MLVIFRQKYPGFWKTDILPAARKDQHLKYQGWVNILHLHINDMSVSVFRP